MKISFYIFSFFIFLSSLILAAPQPIYKTSCEGLSHKYTLNIESKINIIKDFNEGEKFEKETILQQLKYFKAHLKSELHRKKIDTVFADETNDIQILSHQDKKISQEFQLSPVVHPDVQMTQPYLVKALAQKKISSSTRVMEVAYATTLNVFACSAFNSQKEIQNTTMTAPLDPWLAHWISNKKKFHLVQWRKSKFIIPKYFDSEYADIPHPELAWYFWAPNQARAELKHSKALARTTPQIVKAVSLESTTQLENKALVADKNLIKATIIFGIIDPKMKQLDISKFFQDVPVGDLAQWNKIEKQMLSWNKTADIDKGSMYATGFLTNMFHILDMSSYKFSYDKAENKLSISARLKQSLKNIQFSFYYGPTDVLAGESPKHWTMAHEGLAHDDIVLYIGHSGLGENFKSSNIERNVAAINVEKKNRIIGVFSCYSASYFDQDLSQFLNENSMLILTGSSYTSARGPLGVLEWVDRSLVQKEAVKVSQIVPTDFLIFKTLGRNE